MNEGFQLNPNEIVERIAEETRKPGAHLNIWLDTYAHPDFNTGISIVHTAVDRAVVTFVGSREDAAKIYEAAKQVMTGE